MAYPRRLWYYHRVPGRLEMCLGSGCTIEKVLESVWGVAYARIVGAVSGIMGQGLNVCLSLLHWEGLMA